MQTGFEDNVFINCPFDDDYRPLFDAIVFAVHDAGFIARCALEASDSAQNRLQKIMEIIAGCKYGIHDISRTELDKSHNLPRFNMPLELGIDLGCRRFGSKKHKQKLLLILDREPYRYQKFISDIAGQDICAHGNDVDRCIRTTRDHLANASRQRGIPGGALIAKRYALFVKELPVLCENASVQHDELTFFDRANLITEWLKEHPISLN
jgi:hypothetical protein